MRKRISKYKHLHSNRFRYLSSSIPLICASGLLVVLGLMISPMSSIGRFGVDGEVRAKDWNSGGEGSTGDGETGDTTTPAVSMEFAEGTKLEETVGVTASTPTASSVKQLTITPQGSLEKYSIYVQTTSSPTGALVGKDKKETISTLSDTASTGGVALANIGVNQWGYALETGQKTADVMKYKGVSGSGTVISAYDSVANPTSAQEFTLAFAANIGNDKPADHYIANVLVSVAANPGEVTMTLSDVMYMQEVTPAICKNSATNDTKRLIDQRDLNRYWVTKLKDGNCWMTQNLDYDGGGTRINAPSEWTGTNADYAVYYDPGDYYPTDPSKFTACSNNGVGLSNCLSNGWSTGGDSHYHVGNYYSYQTAISGNICPASWQLPTSNSTTNNGSFGYLVNGLNSSTLVKTPYYFIPGGGVWSGLLTYAGSNGYYWSSTARDGSSVYNLNFYSINVNPSNYTGRYVGYSVRCLVQGS